MKTYVLSHPTARQNAILGVSHAPDGMVVQIKESTRNLEQNAALWAKLTDISKQVIWHGKKLAPEDWKNIFTANIKKMDVVPNLDGTGFVALGLSTSKMPKKEMSDLLELITFFGDERQVIWSKE